MSDEKNKLKKLLTGPVYGNTQCCNSDDGQKYFKIKDRELQINKIIDKDGTSVKLGLYDMAVKLGYIVEKEENNGR